MPQVKKTSINIDAALWKEWLLFVVEKYGTSRKVSVALADAIREYMEKHKEG
jgi:metal-responsive CopG/Arc/MetJ family transcriptional regulator